MSLTNLPAEILANILKSLDLLSIYNLSLTQSTIHAQIQTHNTYHYLTSNQTTKEALKILSQTTILTRHSLTTLTRALHSLNCTCCGRRAPYIYLPTAKRACLVCVHHCAAFQLIPIDLASTTFATPVKYLTNIALRTIPGTYSTETGNQDYQQTALLVNVIQGRDLAASMLSTAVLDAFMAQRNIDVAFYTMPLDGRGYFVTPYTGLDFRICQVKIGLRQSSSSSMPKVKKEYKQAWKGLVGMGCEPWPFWNKEMGSYELDHNDIVPYRVANDFQVVKRDELLKNCD